MSNLFKRVINAVRNDDTKDDKESKDIRSKSIDAQLYRFQSNILHWKGAIEDFEAIENPTNEELIRDYNDSVLDPHLSALIDVRKFKSLSKDYALVNENGDEDEDATKLIRTAWFQNCVSLYLDSIFFGFGLIQLGNRIDFSFDSVDIVKREYVYPQKNMVRDSPTSSTGTSWDDPEFRPWLVETGKGEDLGLLVKAVPMTIFKKSAMSSWADFGEVFGSPLRIGRTDIRDDKLRDNMYLMLEEMGRSAYGVLDKEDEIEFIQASKTDAYEVFDKAIERYNSELSKLVLGSTMSMDSGSSRSQGEVHERTSDGVAKLDSVSVEFWVNDCLIPHLIKYHNFPFKGLVFKFDDKEVVSITDQFERDMKLNEAWEVDIDYMIEKYGTPLEKREVPEGPEPKGQKVITKEDVKNILDLRNEKSDTVSKYSDVLRLLYSNK